MRHQRLRYIYAYEKFSNALRSLTLGPGDIRSRLLPAFRSFHTVSVDELPKGLRRDYSWIRRHLTRKEPKDEFEWKYDGRLGVTLKAMKNKTGVKIAERIVKIHDRLESIIK